MIPLMSEGMKEQIEAVKNIILSEINVKEIEYITDTTGVLIKKIKPNFKTLGPKYGKYMKQISAAFAEMNQSDIFQFEKNGEFQLTIGEENIMLGLEDADIMSEDIPGWLDGKRGKGDSSFGYQYYPIAERGRYCPRVHQPYTKSEKGKRF